MSRRRRRRRRSRSRSRSRESEGDRGREGGREGGREPSSLKPHKERERERERERESAIRKGDYEHRSKPLVPTDLQTRAPLGAALLFGGGHACRRERERERDSWGRPPFGGVMRGGERERERDSWELGMLSVLLPWYVQPSPHSFFTPTNSIWSVPLGRPPQGGHAHSSKQARDRGRKRKNKMKPAARDQVS